MHGKSEFKPLFKDIVVPLAIALIPFTSNLYEWWSAPDLHYVFDTKYEKNPIVEWDRNMGKFLKSLSNEGSPSLVEAPQSLLRQIGKEIYNALPVMASGIGLKPFDRMTVRIANVTDHDLKNVRVFFNGCLEFDSFRTFPDTYGNLEEGTLKQMVGKDSVTIRYEKIARSPQTATTLAYITVFVADASSCEPTVQAETDKGVTASGRKTNIDQFNQERAWARYTNQQRNDFVFKLFVVIAVLYLYMRMRALGKARQT